MEFKGVGTQRSVSHSESQQRRHPRAWYAQHLAPTAPHARHAVYTSLVAVYYLSRARRARARVTPRMRAQ